LIVKNTLLAVLSDMHTGSSTALFPAKGFQGESNEDNYVLPNEKQKEIHTIFIRMAGEVAKARQGNRLILVMLGDAIDGFHHGSLQESLFRTKDQCDAHMVLMHEFMKRVGFSRKRGDVLYYVRGTESHVGETENDTAKQLGAVRADSGKYVHEILELNINGQLHVFAHHGKARGTGANEGNGLRNFLRDIRIDREKDGLRRIDVLWSGHTHGFTYNTHVTRLQSGEFHEFRGVICPSFQMKTIYAFGKVPMAINSVGGVYTRIAVSGSMESPPRFVVYPTRDG